MQVLDFLMSSAGQAILMMIMLVIMIVLSLVVLKKFRDNTGDDVLRSDDLLLNFKEMRDQGDISEAEFRKLRTVLSDKPQQPLNDNGETG